MVEKFKKHWFPSLLALCAAVSAFTWGVATQIIEQPLRDQLSQQLVAAKASNQPPVVFVVPAYPQPTASADTDAGAVKPSTDSRVYRDSCAILETGNKLYVAGKYPEALDVYSRVQSVDKIGTTPCTASIYATIATIHALLAEPLLTTNAAEAAEHFKTASLFNRSFAVALLCQTGDCKLARQFFGP